MRLVRELGWRSLDELQHELGSAELVAWSKLYEAEAAERKKAADKAKAKGGGKPRPPKRRGILRRRRR